MRKFPVLSRAGREARWGTEAKVAAAAEVLVVVVVVVVPAVPGAHAVLLLLLLLLLFLLYSFARARLRNVPLAAWLGGATSVSKLTFATISSTRPLGSKYLPEYPGSYPV